MSDFMRQAETLAPQVAPNWLDAQREAGLSAWRAAEFPNRRTEAWKYTQLRRLERGNYLAEPQQTPEPTDIQAHRIPGLDGPRLVFIDGRFQPQLSDTASLGDGVELVRFSEASPEQAESIRSHLGSLVDRRQHLFAALNDSWLADGVFLHLAANAKLEHPLHLLWLQSDSEEAYSLNQRLLVVLEQGAEAALIEHFAGLSDRQRAFTTGISELVVGANARLDHYRLHLEGDRSVHIGGVHARLHRDATLRSFHLALGSTLKRIDLVVEHAEPGAHAELNGIYLPRGKEQIDYHTNIEHAAPHCTSDEIFRGIVADQGHAVFNGRIHIHAGAQKTLAQLSNKNLLASDEAEVDTKPELEIYADDVQCAHGATVAKVDEHLLHYLRSRGISRQEAEVMLSFGFVNELLSRVRHEAVSDYLRPRLARLFAGSPDLARHIV